MRDARFEGREAWIAAVHGALARSDAHPILAAMAIDRDCVLTVARCEASGASDSGISTLSHSSLAESTGLPRSAVLRARLALVELGLEVLACAPSSRGDIDRMLHHR